MSSPLKVLGTMLLISAVHRVISDTKYLRIVVKWKYASLLKNIFNTICENIDLSSLINFVYLLSAFRTDKIIQMFSARFLISQELNN